MRRIALIPARGGSRRIAGKNIRSFHGKPIMAYSIETARESGLFDEIVVSTDCLAIAEVARQYGATVFERPTDDGSRGTQDVAREVLLDPKYADVQEACVIYATSPLLLVSDLILAMDELLDHFRFYAMSVNREPLFDAGCFYFGKASAFKKNISLIGPYTAMIPLPPERVCDINTEADWERSEQLYQRMQEGK